MRRLPAHPILSILKRPCSRAARGLHVRSGQLAVLRFLVQLFDDAGSGTDPDAFERATLNLAKYTAGMLRDAGIGPIETRNADAKTLAEHLAVVLCCGVESVEMGDGLQECVVCGREFLLITERY